jgi:hypothetical protein
MLRQLNQQTFLEMVLKSKANTNEDRFFAILPLTEYKGLIESSDTIDSWNIRSMVSAKLKLYGFMNTKHKLELLFLSSKPSSKFMVLPTFATSRIEWPKAEEVNTAQVQAGGHFPCNFDLISEATIMLKLKSSGNSRKYHEGNDILNIKPYEYYTCNNTIFAENIIEENRTACQRLELDDPDEHFDMVCIPSYGLSNTQSHRHPRDFNCSKLFLVGSFAKNKWMITAALVFTSTDILPDWTLHYANDDMVGFDIY